MNKDMHSRDHAGIAYSQGEDSADRKPLKPTDSDPSDTSDMVKRHPAPDASPPRVPSNYRTFTM